VRLVSLFLLGGPQVMAKYMAYLVTSLRGLELSCWPLPTLSGSIVWIEGLVSCGFGVSKDLSLVHRKTTGTASKANTLGSKLSGIALLAVDFTFMLRATGAVKTLQTQSTIKADFVPFLSTSQDLFGVIDNLGAFGAARLLNGLTSEWHGSGEEVGGLQRSLVNEFLGPIIECEPSVSSVRW